MGWTEDFFLSIRWRLVPLAWPCFEAPSPSEADPVPAMTVSWRLAEPERPSSRQDELRASRIVRLGLFAMLWSGLARWILVGFPGKNGGHRRRRVSVYPGSWALVREEEVVFCCWCSGDAVLPHTCHSVGGNVTAESAEKAGKFSVSGLSGSIRHNNPTKTTFGLSCQFFISACR